MSFSGGFQWYVNKTAYDTSPICSRQPTVIAEPASFVLIAKILGGHLINKSDQLFAVASRNLPTEPGHATPVLQQGAEATQSLASHPDHREVLGYTGVGIARKVNKRVR